MTWPALAIGLFAAGCAGGQGGNDADAQATFGPHATTSGGSGTGSESASEGMQVEPPATTSSSGGEPDADAEDSGSIETCGNGIVEPPEECDEAPQVPCDGCEDCQIRTSIFLDGASSLVEVDDVDQAPLQLLSTPFTVEAWMRIDAPDDAVDILRRGNENSGWRVTMRDDGLIGTVFSGFDHIESGMALAGTGWHHVAWSYDLATSRLFLDGVLVGTMSASAPVLEAGTPMRIGAWVSNEGIISSHRRGRIDEVRVSSSVRYVADFELQRRFAPDGPTVLLLHFDEGSGTAMFDATQWGHTGTATAVEWEPEDGYGIPEFCE